MVLKITCFPESTTNASVDVPLETYDGGATSSRVLRSFLGAATWYTCYDTAATARVCFLTKKKESRRVREQPPNRRLVDRRRRF